jgi:Fe-S-cluster-containing dehydrogenase component
MGRGSKMKKWNLVIDVALCHDCNDCFLADKDEFVGNDFPPYSLAQPWSGHRWMNIDRKERGQHPIVQVAYLPIPCMHCDSAPCLTDDGAVYKRADGLVIIDPVKAKGRNDIVDTCPYGAIYWNKEAGVAQKCTGCVHLLEDGWTETRCSQVCPTGAIKLVLADDAEMARLIAAEGLETLKAEYGTKPRVVYKNLYRWEKVFVAASVAYKDTDECAEGAKVTVTAGGAKAGEGLANNYGEVVVDKLQPGGEYEVLVEAAGYKSLSTRVKLHDSRNLGLLLLEKA